MLHPWEQDYGIYFFFNLINFFGATRSDGLEDG